ncbi:Ig-like domain-containing protein [Moellerella wisconsensis]|uniref:Ig-like domain-containing protein n=1 Tax=Moellerella wisconsensis TaxID=158849 RepID=UPI003B2221EB
MSSILFTLKAICLRPRKVISVSRLTIDKTAIAGTVGDIISLNATIIPDNAFSQNVTWSSADTAKATVNNLGKVTLKAAGKTAITAAIDDVFAKTTVTINEKVN